MTGTQHIGVFSVTSKWYYSEAQSSFLKSLKHFKCSTKHYLRNNISLEIHRKQYIKTTNKNVHSCNTAHSYTLSVLCPIQYHKIESKREARLSNVPGWTQCARRSWEMQFFFSCSAFTESYNKAMQQGLGIKNKSHEGWTSYPRIPSFTGDLEEDEGR